MLMNTTRRSILSAIGAAIPFGLGDSVNASNFHVGMPPVLRFRPFEEAVREAFADHAQSNNGPGYTFSCRRIEVGHSDLVSAGVQGCHNDRPFAGVPAGRLRIIRTGSEPGPVWQGVRLYVSTVDVVLIDGLHSRRREPTA